MRLSLIGRGVRPWEHLTIAGLRALKQAEVALGIEPDQGAWQALSQEFSLPPIRSLDFLYRDGMTDEANYKAFHSFILDVCAQHDHVALLMAGHPRLGVTIARWLAASTLPEHIELEVIEGVSSFDTMFNDLERDPLEKGTALIDANRLLLFKYKIEPTIDTFIYHVSSVGNARTDYVDSTERNQIQLLVEHLKRFYPAGAKVVLCKAANITGGASEYINVTLDSLVEHALLIDPGTTLFIPGQSPKSFNTQFFSTLRSSHDSSQLHCY